MTRRADLYKESGFTFYGKWYKDKKTCMAMNGIKTYSELNTHIQREKAGKPFKRRRSHRLSQEAEMSKRRYFARKLIKEGFWKGKDE